MTVEFKKSCLAVLSVFFLIFSSCAHSTMDNQKALDVLQAKYPQNARNLYTAVLEEDGKLEIENMKPLFFNFNGEPDVERAANIRDIFNEEFEQVEHILQLRGRDGLSNT